MKRIQWEEGLDETPLVGEYFDVVGGAGSGAIVTTLTTRLGISTEAVVEIFARLSKEVFVDGRMAGPAFKTSKMERVLQSIVKDANGDENKLMFEETEVHEQCKTMVFAMSGMNMNAGIPVIFRSYYTAVNASPNCEIWKVLRAATAHPEMFKSMEIGENGVLTSYVDAAMGCGNPIEHVLREARQIYPNRRVSCIVSIGGGHPRTIQIPEASHIQRIFPTNVIVAMRDIATDNERIAQSMAVRFQGFPNVYFRFNVQQGMQTIHLGDWDRLGEIKAHANAETQNPTTVDMMKRAVKSIKGRKGIIPMKHIDGEIQLDRASHLCLVKKCPAPMSAYTERQKPIRQAIDCLTNETKDRRVFVFHGLGGAGKTQLALQIVQQTREHWSDVVYVDATSVETLQSNLKAFALSKRVGDTYEDALCWLASCVDPWLILFDNLDDVSIDLRHYFPKCAHGRILITTRSRDSVLLAQGPDSDCLISSMEPNEALQLLLLTSRSSTTTLSIEDIDIAKGLLEEMGFLALAVVQAGAYIWRTSCSFAKYRDIYQKKPAEALERHGRAILRTSGYGSTSLLWLMAHLQRDRITPEIFRRVALGIKTFKPVLPLTNNDRLALELLEEYLDTFLNSDATWQMDIFSETITEIMSYSLISFDRLNETYGLHVLVQDWIQAIIPHTPEVSLSQSTFLLSLSIGYCQGQQHHAFRRSLELHVTKILKLNKLVDLNSAGCLAHVLRGANKLAEAEALQLRVLREYTRVLGKDHQHTLDAASELADTLNDQGQFKQAASLRASIFTITRQNLGIEDLHTLRALDCLASTYAKMGSYKKAADMQGFVLERRAQLLGNNHPETLSTASNLAHNLLDLGFYKQAEGIALRVLDTRNRILGPSDPGTLSAMSNLACVYLAQGRYNDAESLELRVLEEKKQLFGDEDIETIMAINNIAASCYKQGRFDRAEELQLQALDVLERLLGKLHPLTLSATMNLALTYSDHGLHEKAEGLAVGVLQGRKQVLGETHPDTLDAMLNLASIYSDQELHSLAEPLELQALEALKSTLGDRHPVTLLAMHNLADTYHKQGLIERAETMHTQVMQARKETLGDMHSDTVASADALTRLYSQQLSFEKAQPVGIHALEGKKQAYGDEHENTVEAMRQLALIYRCLNQFEETAKLLTRMIDIRKRTMGAQDPCTIRTMRLLLEVYECLGSSHRFEFKSLKAEIKRLEAANTPNGSMLKRLLSFFSAR
ncbi:kinesin light chain [Ceratobasidium sp. AG-Ba]|nr:kinesin light chain [Ceratobasidium sp. AG-Ba]